MYGNNNVLNEKIFFDFILRLYVIKDNELYKYLKQNNVLQLEKSLMNKIKRYISKKQKIEFYILKNNVFLYRIIGRGWIKCIKKSKIQDAI